MGTPSHAPRWTRGWEAIVDEASYPVLSRLLRSAEAAEVRVELERLLGHFWQDRAHRYRVRTAAELVLPRGEGAVPVQTVDVSRTGALLRVPFGHEIDVMTAAELAVRFEVRTEAGPASVCFDATLVRMDGVDEEGVRLGVRFSHRQPDDSELAQITER
jgi:hypothetical protein